MKAIDKKKPWRVVREDLLHIEDFEYETDARRCCYEYNKTNQPEFMDYVSYNVKDQKKAIAELKKNSYCFKQGK